MIKTIVLIGPPGSGKTICGQALARLLNWSFLDTDCLIEKQAGMSVADIFALKGEKHFRQCEHKQITSLAALACSGHLHNFIIGTGGGLAYARGHFEILTSIGEVVCLKASTNVLLKRMSASACRPLLNTGKKQALEKLLQQRQACYDRAAHKIDTSAMLPEAVASSIVKLLKIPA